MFHAVVLIIVVGDKAVINQAHEQLDEVYRSRFQFEGKLRRKNVEGYILPMTKRQLRRLY
jgi:hypothetical protein